MLAFGGLSCHAQVGPFCIRKVVMQAEHIMWYNPAHAELYNVIFSDVYMKFSSCILFVGEQIKVSINCNMETTSLASG